MKKEAINVFWFRRDLRLDDNTALNKALSSGKKVLPIFIFDDHIIDGLSTHDARISFIYTSLQQLHQRLVEIGSGLNVYKGTPEKIWATLLSRYTVDTVFINKDYEPYSISRDGTLKDTLRRNGVQLKQYKDHVVFEENEVVKADGKPYTVFTPYKKAWLKRFHTTTWALTPTPFGGFLPNAFDFPSLDTVGFAPSPFVVPPANLNDVELYHATRDLPAPDATTHLGPHLRFGTVSIRTLITSIANRSETLLSELIWREFFMQILFHFPEVVHRNFRSKYNGIKWRNDAMEFEQWSRGTTGYPFVDAGMRQLNATGFMHNRARMVVASFLCKHLLIDWRWGEAYFAEKLLDFELASNNGNWQWAAGTGCDAAPYFRIFNPLTQAQRFDPKMEYIRQWVPEVDEPDYSPMVPHSFARTRALETYAAGIALAI
jgi:deoxyribodipyrimidine photo-lyase